MGDFFLFKKTIKLDSYLDYHGFLIATWEDENHSDEPSGFFLYLKSVLFNLTVHLE